MSRLARLGYIDVRRTTNPVRRKVRSRGVPPALANNEIFYTEDVKAASRLIAKTLGPLQLTVGADEVAGFAATMHGVRLRNVYTDKYLDLAQMGTANGTPAQIWNSVEGGRPSASRALAVSPRPTISGMRPPARTSSNSTSLLTLNSATTLPTFSALPS